MTRGVGNGGGVWEWRDAGNDVQTQGVWEWRDAGNDVQTQGVWHIKCTMFWLIDTAAKPHS